MALWYRSACVDLLKNPCFSEPFIVLNIGTSCVRRGVLGKYFKLTAMTNRRKFLLDCTMAAGAVTLLRPLQVFAQLGAVPDQRLANTLCLLHTADLNGQAVATADIRRGLGGAEALQTTLQKLKATRNPTLLVHVGNVANVAKQDRNECLQLYRTLHDAGYDAVVPGESDLARGDAYFATAAAEAGLPSFEKVADEPLPTRVVHKGLFRVGLINASAVYNKQPSIQAALVNKTARSLKSRGCNLVVCLAHRMSAGNKHLLARKSTEVDVIMGCAEKLSVHNAEIICNGLGAEVVLSRVGAAGSSVSSIEFSFASNGQRTGFAARNFFVGAENENLPKLMQRYRLGYA